MAIDRVRLRGKLGNRPAPATSEVTDRTRVVHDVVPLPLANIKANARNARTHSKKQIGQIAESIRAFGFTSPLLVDEQHVLIAGHGRKLAAEQLSLSAVPTIVIEGLTDAEKRALMLADNRITQNAGWDRELLLTELTELPELLTTEGLDISITGFEPAEVDMLTADLEDGAGDLSDEIPDGTMDGPPVSQFGDLWILGGHRLLCGDARDTASIARLMRKEKADVVFLDPPYNVSIRGIVGRGRTKHAEFKMASGEMSSEQFRTFLQEALGAVKAASAPGALHYVCMDWAHVEDLLAAGRTVYDALINIAVWVKSNAGQGSFYRSQHELVCVFRAGKEQHRNNVELGKHGRSRSNVWHYAGVNSFRPNRMQDLRSHPTVKPTGLVADILKDCTGRRDIVLDTFAGSGTTLLAAERVGRVARCIEIEPKYVDVAIRRWEAYTGKDAVHIPSRKTFFEIRRDRLDDEVIDGVRLTRRLVQK
jgi:DNA modification methylase